jgi:SAM-dependent methyltransferase
MPQSMYLPSPQRSFNDDLWAWYQNPAKELSSKFLNEKEAEHFAAYYHEAGLLRWTRRPFFQYHFCRTFARSAAFLLEKAKDGVILDLGCGCGTQSLYLALNGAKVLALDLDDMALAVLQRRKSFYEELSGRRLDITVCRANAFTFDYASIAPIACVHSMFAFNMMQPSADLLDRIVPHLLPGSRVAILDGNSISWLARLLPWRRRPVWSPHEFRNQLLQRGFRILAHEGGIVLPPFIWCIIAYEQCSRIDRVLAKNWLFPISHLILAEMESERS